LCQDAAVSSGEMKLEGCFGAVVDSSKGVQERKNGREK